jgi:arsenite transporter
MINTDAGVTNERKMTSIFERYLTLWVFLCIIIGILLGRFAPGVAHYLDGLAIYVQDAPVVSIPIAICLFLMMYPIMVKIDFASVIEAGKSGKPVFLTLFINWCIKPFTMYAIAMLFLGYLFRSFIGVDATDLVKMPFGLNLPVGATHGAGTVVLMDGVRMLEIPLWRSYLAGCILLGIAPCTAMVLVWSFLSRGNDGLTLVMVAINSLTMLVLYGLLGVFCWAWDDCRCRGRRCCCRFRSTWLCRWWRAMLRADGSLQPRGRTGSRKSSCLCSRRLRSSPC